MAFANSQDVNIDFSTFYDIQGNHYFSSPGERGAYSATSKSVMRIDWIPTGIHDSQQRNLPPRCLPGARLGSLKDIMDWIVIADERTFWISGPEKRTMEPFHHFGTKGLAVPWISPCLNWWRWFGSDGHRCFQGVLSCEVRHINSWFLHAFWPLTQNINTQSFLLSVNILWIILRVVR